MIISISTFIRIVLLITFGTKPIFAEKIYGVRVDAPAEWLVADLLHDEVCRSDERLELLQRDQMSKNFQIYGNHSLVVSVDAHLTENISRIPIEILAARSPSFRRIITLQVEIFPKTSTKFRVDKYTTNINTTNSSLSAGTALNLNAEIGLIRPSTKLSKNIEFKFVSFEWTHQKNTRIRKIPSLLKIENISNKKNEKIAKILLARNLVAETDSGTVEVFIGAFDATQRLAVALLSVNIIGPPPIFSQQEYRIVTDNIIPHRTIARTIARAWTGVSTYRIEPETAPFDVAPLFGDVFASRYLPNGRYVFHVVALDCSAQESRAKFEVIINDASHRQRNSGNLWAMTRQQTLSKSTSNIREMEERRAKNVFSAHTADKNVLRNANRHLAKHAPRNSTTSVGEQRAGRRVRKIAQISRGNDLVFVIAENCSLGIMKEHIPLNDGEHITKASRSNFAATSKYFIVHSNGSLALIRPLNFEVENLLQLSLQIDSDFDSRIQTILVEIADVFEPPRFINTPRPFLAVVPFQPSIGHRVYQLNARTENGDGNGSVIYRLINTDPTNSFSVDERNGIVRTLLAQYTPNTRYRVFVQALDSRHLNARNNTNEIAVVEIYSGDLPPQFIQQKYIANVAEDASIGHKILQLEAISFPSISRSKRVKSRIIYSLRAGESVVHTKSSLKEGSKQKISSDTDGGILEYFDIDSIKGIVKLEKPLDYENPAQIKSFLLYGVATEDELHSIVPIEIHVRDINDNAPVFTQPLYATTVREDVPIGQVILRVRAIDQDSGANGVIRYSVNHPDFMINDRGEIAVFRRLDADQHREGYFIYRFNVTAYDEGRPRGLSTNALIHIRTENVNDEAPQFVGTNDEKSNIVGNISEFRASVAEDAQAGTPILQLQALDPDRDQVVYSFYDEIAGENVDKIGFFRIDRDTGLIRLQSAFNNMDKYGHVLREHSIPSLYNITVVASDDGSCCKGGNELKSHRQLAHVYVSVADVNNNKPEFPQCAEYSAMAKLEEGQYRSNGPVIVKAKAIDEDSGLNGKVKYSLYYSRAETRKPFVIDGDSGELRPSPYFIFDREQKAFEEVTIKATDRGERPLIGFCQFSVQILDVNDNAPQFDRPLYETSLARNALTGALVLSVLAEDADAPVNARVTYSLASDEAAALERRKDFRLFEIVNPNSGDISLKQRIPPGIERFAFSVIATDNGIPEPRTSAVPVVVKVHDRAQNVPQWQSGKYCKESIHVDENIQINSLLLKCFAIVNDDRQAPISYKLTNGVKHGQYSSERQLFREFVEKASGEGPDFVVVRNMENFDYERAHNYTLTLTATDMISLATSEKHFHILVKDKNDEVPRFTVDQFVGAIDEELSPAEYMEKYDGAPITVVRAVDADARGPQSEIHYRILVDSGGVSNFFRIDELTGGVFPMAKFDREQQDSFIFDVEASDSMPSSLPNAIGPNKDIVKVQVFVTDLNDNPPYFPHPFYSESVAENVEISKDILTIRAEDPDSQSILRYSLYAADASANNEQNQRVPFGVRTDSGVIYVKEPLDHESREMYDLVVVCSDGRHNVSTPLRIYVRDVNDNAPVFAQSVYETVVEEESEESELPKALFSVHATDLDKNDTNGQIVYALEGESVDRYFRVERNTGLIKLIRPLDRDPPNGIPVWKFIAQAIDNDGKGLIGYADVQVLVKDINDNAPIFTSETFATLLENSEPDTFITQVRALDADDPTTPNAELEYSINLNKELDGSPIFRIEAHSGKIFSRIKLDREKSSQNQFHLQIRATDKGIPSREGIGNVTIRVLDVNDNPPYFEREEYEVVVPETTPRYSPILTFTAKDPDYEAIDNVFTYELISGPEELFYVTTEDDSRGSKVGVLRLNQSKIGQIDRIPPIIGKDGRVHYDNQSKCDLLADIFTESFTVDNEPYISIGVNENNRHRI